MQEFLFIVSHLPVIVFTILLAFVVVYWLTVIAGALDIDLFNIDAELDVGGDVGADGAELGGFASALEALGLAGVPLTISLSLFVLFNWMLTFLGAYFLGGGKAELGVGAQAGVVLGGMVLGLVATSLVTRPMRPLFKSKKGARGAAALVGSTVKIISGVVNEREGRGELPLEGSTVNVSVRCEVAGNGLVRGSEALIVSYDEVRHIYYVEPLSQMLGSGKVSGAQSQVSLEDAFKELEEAQSRAEEEVSGARARGAK